MFKYMLAPLEDISGSAFRTVCHRNGADLTFTEMARVDALARGNRSTWARLEQKDSTPTCIQLLGSKEQSFARFLKNFSPYPGFSGFNLNLSCPSPNIISAGLGCAMIRRISLTKRLVSLFHDTGYSISVKMRLGLNLKDKQNRAYLNLIEAVDADYFIVHARHGCETYDQPADFRVYDKCVSTGKSIIANGDITTKQQIENLMTKGLDGAMIGRAAIHDPAVFARLKSINAPPAVLLINQILDLSLRYNEPARYRNNLTAWTGHANI